MEDIIGTVAEKAGIPETKAKLAVMAVFEKVDDVLPGPLAGQVKKALGIDAGGMASSAMGDLGGLLGGGDDNDDDGDNPLGALGDAAKGLLG